LGDANQSFLVHPESRGLNSGVDYGEESRTVMERNAILNPVERTHFRRWRRVPAVGLGNTRQGCVELSQELAVGGSRKIGRDTSPEILIMEIYFGSGALKIPP